MLTISYEIDFILFFVLIQKLITVKIWNLISIYYGHDVIFKLFCLIYI